MRWAIKEMDTIKSDDDYVAIEDLAGKSKQKHLNNKKFKFKKKYSKVLQNVKGLGIVAEEIEYIEPTTTTTTTKDIPIPLSESTPPTNASRRGEVVKEGGQGIEMDVRMKPGENFTTSSEMKPATINLEGIASRWRSEAVLAGGAVVAVHKL